MPQTAPFAKPARDAAESEFLSGAGQGRGQIFDALKARLNLLLNAAIEKEIALRRPFLWTPVAAGAGVLLYFAAEHEPSFYVALALFLAFGLGAVLARHHPRFFVPALVLACLAGGFFSAVWRAARVEAPTMTRISTASLKGFVEEVDLRPNGARFLLRVVGAEGLSGEAAPARVRLTTRGDPNFKAGDFIALKARLLPPAQAALPGGYDFSRDAYFLGLGAVGNALGRVEVLAPPSPAPASLAAYAAVDRARNALAARVYATLSGDTGAIAAAMVTGKRDYLSDSAKELIRRAGIFHIVTISGVQMALVAGIFFVGLRRLFAFSQTLALNYPIKKWAAALVILGAVVYDIGTGSRVGTERALVMTLIMLVATLFDRPAFSMRNLAFAAFYVIAFEPEALLGASFQLSFAAVAALITVYEARGEARAPARALADFVPQRPESLLARLTRGVLTGPAASLFATLCATSATAAFMANDFHELSPYVLIGNPLTLAIIEFFAVPCALLGAALYPLGLDGLVWRYLGLGIDLVTYIAQAIASAPGAGLPVKSFAPYAIIFLTLALLSVVLWRSWTLRATAVPFAVIGLLGASTFESFDLAVGPTGAAAALRIAGGGLALLGRNPNAFAAEQWLRADADARAPADAAAGVSCDESGCVARAMDGRHIALVEKKSAFVEDCAKADVVVTPLYAPQGCGAKIIIDKRKLEESGAVTLRFTPEKVLWRSARATGQDRPWSRPPRPRKAPAAVADSPESTTDSGDEPP